MSTYPPNLAEDIERAAERTSAADVAEAVYEIVGSIRNGAYTAPAADPGQTVIARMDLWTGADTAEGGPTLDECDTSARIEAVERGAMLHATAVDEAGNLWTVALYLNRPDAASLARDLAAAAAAEPV